MERPRAFFNGLLRGPEMIGRLEEFIGSPQCSSTSISEDAAGLRQILSAFNYYYELSPRQQELFEEVIGEFATYRASSVLAQQMLTKEPSFKKRCADRLNVSPLDIVNVIIQPTSVCFEMTTDSFLKARSYLWGNDINPGDLTDVGGTAFKDQYLELDAEHRLPISVIKTGKYALYFAEHEHRHQIYYFLHPYDKDNCVTMEQYLQYLKTIVGQFVADQDHQGFDNFLTFLRQADIAGYLNELQAEAIGRNTNRVFAQYFTNTNYTESIYRQMKSDAMASAFPQDRAERSLWQDLLDKQQRKTRWQAEYIDNGCGLIARRKSPRETWATIAFLIPEQGYLINAFTGIQPVTFANIRRWQREYG